MIRHLALSLVLTLGVSSAAWAQPPAPRGPRKLNSPAWLPREAFVGTFFRQGAISPLGRLQWQLPFFRTSVDLLAVVAEGGAAVTVAYPDTVVSGANVPLESLQLYTATVGLAYRNTREEGLQWGFHVVTGPAWYSARFSGGAKDRESYFIGFLEGRAQVGHRFGPLVLGLGVGYGEPYNYRRASLARPYLGGLKVGLFADWR